MAWLTDLFKPARKIERAAKLALANELEKATLNTQDAQMVAVRVNAKLADPVFRQKTLSDQSWEITNFVFDAAKKAAAERLRREANG